MLWNFQLVELKAPLGRHYRCHEVAQHFPQELTGQKGPLEEMKFSLLVEHSVGGYVGCIPANSLLENILFFFLSSRRSFASSELLLLLLFDDLFGEDLWSGTYLDRCHY
ncbi:hypothetical protein RJT34_32010 [Clitoria ternatea]|uniref:Uncharacterized protein n=1 Tax=Clitoria ternatea TaxID=43366 RepID=A0AAN9I8Z6_CLITE